MNQTEKLTEALKQKTTAALAQLAHLDADIAVAFAEAELEAQARINARLAVLQNNLAAHVSHFETAMADMASSAFESALDHLAGAVLALGTHLNGKPAEVPVPTIDEQEADTILNTLKETTDDLDAPVVTELQEGEPTYTGSAQAAQSLVAEPVGVLPDDEDTEDDNDPDDDQEAAQAIPYVYSGEGLHEKKGKGRSTRYVEVDVPIAGETYYLPTGKAYPRWTPVIYAG